ncbi:MAG TPA: hypothetical protein VK590_09245, partial [Saprospiraceae bacterium]|nr:hypothetical protein [Saprospiraceae bacterium]
IIKSGSDSSSLIIDNDGNMTFHYSGDIVSRNSKEIYSTIPPILAFITDTVFGFPIKLSNNIKLKKASLTDGVLGFSLQSKHTQDVKVTITIPELTKNGQPWTVTQNLYYTGSVPVSALILPQSIAGWKLDLPGDSLHVHYKAIKADGTPDTLSQVILAGQNLKFSYVEGYFGYEVFPVKRDTIYLDIYKNLLGGELNFEDPRVRITLYNSFGFPLRCKTNIAKFRGSNGQLYDLQSPFVTNGFDFKYPPLDQVGKTVLTKFDFDKTNSNMNDIINSSPIYMDYQIDAVANPDSDPNNIGFMTDSSTFLVNVSVDLPLKGRAKDFRIDGDYEANFGKLDGFTAAEFKLITENEMPVDMKLQMYFIDGAGVVLDSLFGKEQLLVEAAPVDANGEVNGINKKENYINCTGSQLDAIRHSKKVSLKAFLSTNLNGTIPVNIKSTQGLNIKMGVKAKIKSKL